MPSVLLSPYQLIAQPLTHEAWAPYGDVIQGANDASSMPAGIVTNKITANPILGHKFNRVSPITSHYPSASSPEAQGTPHTSISVARIGPPKGLQHGGTFDIRMLERHAASSQAFLPLAKAGAEWDDFTSTKGLDQVRGGGMIVVGCLNGADNKPDLSTLKVFVTSPAQGVCYHAGIWHHSAVTFAHADYAVIDTQITTDGSLLIDLEIVRPAEDEPAFASVQLPQIV